MRPETSLLLATGGGPALDGLITRVARTALDWALFLRLTAAERAEAIVSARLSKLAPAMPDDIRSQLAGLALRSDLRMTLLSQRLTETLTAFANAGIPVVLLKGAALGRIVYGSLPRRPMLDLDLLVPRHMRAQAREVALGAGWLPTEYDRLAGFYDGHYHIAPLLDSRGRSFHLEIHSALFPTGHPFAWPMEAFWARSEPLSGTGARVPSREDLLLHVALHFSWSHLAQFGPWRTFRDVRAQADEPRLDWDRFVSLARESRGASAAFWTLRLARRYAGAAIPDEVERALLPALPASVLPMLERHFAGQWCNPDAPCPSRRLERGLWRLAIRPHWSEHGSSVPWERNPLFHDPESARPPVEPVGLKLVRHLSSPGRYLRYLHRITLGADS